MVKLSFITLLFCISLIMTLCGCGNRPDTGIRELQELPEMDPEYSGITIPPNIAPLNFIIKEKGARFCARFYDESKIYFEISSGDGIIQIPGKKWNKMLKNCTGKNFKIDIYTQDRQGNWVKYKTVNNFVAVEAVDPYLSYRLLYPGYESWSDLSIRQRDLQGFREIAIIENSVANENCVNCHSFNNGRSDDFLFHMRGNLGGTYFYSEDGFKKINLKIKEVNNGAVYPRWHPSGRYVAFSSNKIVQQFHAADKKKVEVTDLESSLILYDVQKNEIMDVDMSGKEKAMDTYPEWSADGKWLFFCRADSIGKDYDYRQIRYNLYRISFNEDERSFGEPELIFDAAKLDKSVSFPRISPDGRFLVFTMADYGCFPIWHKEADLFAYDMQLSETVRMELNSAFTDSYHSWSSNGRWLVFSSKRNDGITARPYIAYIDENGNSSKPFVLPQEDPEFYQRFLKSFNIPEFSTARIRVNPGKIRRTTRAAATDAKWSDN